MGKYDFLIVGAGLFGAVFAYEATKQNKRCLVIEKRNHIGGNCYTEKIAGIDIHKYGAHIFRTSNKEVWDFIKGFSEFNHFINSPIANYKGEIYNLPFNMNTFNKMWGVITPAEARKKIAEQCSQIKSPADNLEDHVISLVGKDVYEKLVKGYTEKQWGHKCCELPPSIMRRLPVRFTYDNNYFNDIYQGIPIEGYTEIINKMLNNCDVELNVDFNENKRDYINVAQKIIYTGTIDSFYKYCFGPLEYRSLRFEHELLDCDNYQGVAVVNYTDSDTPYTRIIEHKHFVFGKQPKTIISKEYPLKWNMNEEPYYPLNNDQNQKLYNKYRDLAANEDNIYFGGRLGEYKYYDMQDTILSARALAVRVLS